MSPHHNILFICQHNSGPSQMAEACLRKFAGEEFAIESAGIEAAAGIHPLVAEVLKEGGIDLSGK